jgi:hypothetical protein
MDWENTQFAKHANQAAGDEFMEKRQEDTDIFFAYRLYV